MSDPIPEHPEPCGLPSVQPCVCPIEGEQPYEYETSAVLIDACAAKLGEPYHMHLCGRPAIYLTAQEAEDSGRGVHSGWRHVKPADDEDHGAVPKRAFGL